MDYEVLLGSSQQHRCLRALLQEGLRLCGARLQAPLFSKAFNEAFGEARNEAFNEAFNTASFCHHYTCRETSFEDLSCASVVVDISRVIKFEHAHQGLDASKTLKLLSVCTRSRLLLVRLPGDQRRRHSREGWSCRKSNNFMSSWLTAMYACAALVGQTDTGWVQRGLPCLRGSITLRHPVRCGVEAPLFKEQHY